MKSGVSKVITNKDNIFAELSVEDAEIMKIRAQLLVELKKYIEASDLSHTQLATKLKTRRPIIYAALNENLEECSIERLIKVIVAAGGSVSVNAKIPKSK